MSSAEVFVKVHLLENAHRIAKRKTAAKRGETQPSFNEAMIFSVTRSMLNVSLHVSNGDGSLKHFHNVFKKQFRKNYNEYTVQYVLYKKCILIQGKSFKAKRIMILDLCVAYMCS